MSNTTGEGGQQRRQFSRVAFHVDAIVETPDEKVQGRLLDISLKGALVELPRDWTGAPGESCHLAVPLGEGGLTIEMEGAVAHITGKRIGVQCKKIDLDSITNLRRLVELNLGGEALLERELSALINLSNAPQ